MIQVAVVIADSYDPNSRTSHNRAACPLRRYVAVYTAILGTKILQYIMSLIHILFA